MFGLVSLHLQPKYYIYINQFKIVLVFDILQNWYASEILLSAWDMMLMARNDNNESSLYKHDLVDITRQVLQLTADAIYLKILAAYTNKDITELK